MDCNRFNFIYPGFTIFNYPSIHPSLVFGPYPCGLLKFDLSHNLMCFQDFINSWDVTIVFNQIRASQPHHTTSSLCCKTLKTDKIWQHHARFERKQNHITWQPQTNCTMAPVIYVLLKPTAGDDQSPWGKLGLRGLKNNWQKAYVAKMLHVQLQSIFLRVKRSTPLMWHCWVGGGFMLQSWISKTKWQKSDSHRSYSACCCALEALSKLLRENGLTWP